MTLTEQTENSPSVSFLRFFAAQEIGNFSRTELQPKQLECRCLNFFFFFFLYSGQVSLSDSERESSCKIFLSVYESLLDVTEQSGNIFDKFKGRQIPM